MYGLLLFCYLVVAIALVLVILLQKSPGIAIQAKSTFAGPRARSNVLTKFTGFLAFTFVCFCLILTRINMQKNADNKQRINIEKANIAKSNIEKTKNEPLENKETTSSMQESDNKIAQKITSLENLGTATENANDITSDTTPIQDIEPIQPEDKA